MVTAGLTAGLTDAAGLGTVLPKTAPFTDRLVQDIQRGLIRATVRAGVSTAINGGKLDEALVSALRLEAATIIGENLTQEIGAAYHGGEIDKFTQLVAHAAVGCLSGSVASGNCAGGAIGEVAAEIQQGRIEDRLKAALQDGSMTQEQALIMVSEMRAQGVDIARVAAGLGAALAGEDVNTAADAGGTAAENNAFWVPIIIIIAALLETADKVLIAKDAVDITLATVQCNNGSQAACNQAKDLAQQAAVDAGIELTIGSVIPGSKAAADLLRWVRKNADTNTLKTVENVVNGSVKIKKYPDGSYRTPDGKFASQGGVPAPGTLSAQEYTQFLRDKGFDVVGEELTVKGVVGNRRYDTIIRDNKGELWGIEYKSGGARKTPQQDLNDMYINRFGADGVGKLKGETVVGNMTIYLP